jgi:hypothetical protein
MIFSGIVWLRLLKLLAASLWAAGTIGAFLPRDLVDRQRAAYFLMGPGFGLSWILGFLLLFARQLSPLTTWTLGAMVVSFFSLNVVLWSVGKEGRRGPIGATLAIGSLVAVFALMVFRPA